MCIPLRDLRDVSFAAKRGSEATLGHRGAGPVFSARDGGLDERPSESHGDFTHSESL